MTRSAEKCVSFLTAERSRHPGMIQKARRSPLESRSCQVCHKHDNPLDGTAVPNHDDIVELPEVYCDAGLIHSAIMDIVSNALEACLSKEYEDGESPQVDLATTHFEASGRFVIEISDNGPGMTEGVKANIFTPFFSTKRDKGTGLGLALTSRFVNLHGGAIEVVSEPGAGATFRILLPVAGPDKNKENRDGKESAGHR